jgi:DnaK suppressor protein
VVEHALRERYDAVWSDIRREIEKHKGQQYGDLIQGAPDPEDVATADLVIDSNLAEIDRDADELRAIQRALARLKAGNYDVCEDCGGQISSARLGALPYATRCTECQARAERNRVSTPSL